MFFQQEMITVATSGVYISVGWCLCVVFHQALDGDFSEDNRNKCRIATAPLIEAVENLTAFASNPEFVSIPAQISSEVGIFAAKLILQSLASLCGTEWAWIIKSSKSPVL